MKSCVIIPARFKSSRFEGKPLVKLLNKEMIIWVAEIAAKAVGKSNVFIATDNLNISQKVKEYGFNFLMTSSELLTGTDRVAAAAKNLNYDIFVNVQGDEPLIDPQDILKSIDFKKKYPSSMINSFCYLRKDEDPHNKNIPKVITNEENNLIYISRAVTPSSKSETLENFKFKKQECIYSYFGPELDQFLSFGRKSLIENIEDIEILRFHEMNIPVRMLELEGSPLHVDTPADLERAQLIAKDYDA